jgi:hypothetical protein
MEGGSQVEALWDFKMDTAGPFLVQSDIPGSKFLQRDRKWSNHGFGLNEVPPHTCGVSKITFITDPSGTRIEIIERAPMGPQVN